MPDIGTLGRSLPQQVPDVNSGKTYEVSQGSPAQDPPQVGDRSIAHVMADSKEELTFQFSALREQSKNGFNLKLAAGASWARVVQIEKIRELFEQITGEPTGILADRSKKLIDKLANSQDAFDAVKELESDPTLQYLVLREALHTNRDPILRDKLQTALELVQEQPLAAGYLASRVAKADMASAEAISQASPDQRMRRLLRETYRGLVTGFDTAAEMAVHLLERYPEPDVLKAIKTLARALGDDLRSKLASSQPGKLEATLKDLKSIQTITSTLSAAEKALRSVAAKGGAIKRSSVRVATDLIRLAHLNPAERFITDVLLGHVDGEKSVKLGYLSSCGTIFTHAFPSTLWLEEDSKERWLNCITEYLNREDPREMKAV